MRSVVPPITAQVRRLAAVGALIVAVVAAATALTDRASAPRAVAQVCAGSAPTPVTTGAVPGCVPGLSGGSVSAGPPSEGLITAKNWCNLIFGGCSSAFFYPPGPALGPHVDTSVRHNP